MQPEAPTNTIDFIGDVHGFAKPLKQLLNQLGYQKTQHGWTHKFARLVFLGDLIDRGPDQKETVDLVRSLCESGLATCLSGNHEFNAIGFVTPRPDKPDHMVRSHTDNHIAQHAAFLEAYANDRAGYEETLAWFRTLPIWFESDQVRAVHACWHPASQRILAPYLDAAHRPRSLDFFQATGIPESPAWEAREVTLNGLEARLPQAASFQDYYGVTRRKIRVNWWASRQQTYRDAAVIDETQRTRIPDVPMQEAVPDYQGTLCFFGHYWMRGRPRIEHPRAVCLDYSVALKDGVLCGYRFQNEVDACDAHLVWASKT
jgi:hypothetical protein